MNGPYPVTPKTPEQILAARARSLAIEEARKDAIDRIAILAFCLAEEVYGIEVRHTSGVAPLQNVSYIPGAPDFIPGIINMRGKIMSVVDLKKFFGIYHENPEKKKMLVILKNRNMEFCLLADNILGIRHIVPDEITASLPTLTGIRSDYLFGVSGDGAVILDAEKLLCAPEMVIDIDY